MGSSWVAQFLSPEHIAMTLLITGAIGTALGVGAKLLRKRAAKD
jgi:hypothetical protein